MKKIDWLAVVFIIILSIFSLRDLYKAGFYTSHDGIHQVVRLYYFNQALSDGQIPPRWAGGLLNGYGYPLFVFSYQLPWLLAQPFRLLNLSVFESIKAVFLLGYCLSGVTMYFFLKKLVGRGGSLVGTVIYLFAPFRFSNIFVRAAIGDATVFIFPPFLFLSLYSLQIKNKISWPWIVLGAVSLSGMLLSHAMVFLFYFLAFWLYCLFVAVYRKKINLIISSVVITILTFGLSAYYFLPSFVEKNLTKFSQIMGPAHLGQYFLSLKELVYSTWGYGVMHSPEGAMSLQLGFAQWLSVVLFILLVLFLHKKINRKSFFPESLIFLFIFVITIFLMLPASKIFWQSFSRIMVVDFPWRILSLTVFTSSVLAAFFIAGLPNKRLKFIFGFMLIFLAFYANRNHLRINQVLDWPLDFCLKLERTTNTYDEYTPKWVNFDATKKAPSKIETSIPSTDLKIREERSNYLSFSLDLPKETKVRINTVYYPGWEVFVDGQPTAIQYDQGVIEFPVKSGKTEIVSRFRETPLRLFSDLLTVLTLSVIIYGFVIAIRRLAKKQSHPRLPRPA